MSEHKIDEADELGNCGTAFRVKSVYNIKEKLTGFSSVAKTLMDEFCPRVTGLPLAQS